MIYDVKPVGWATCKCLRRFWRGCLLSRLHGLSLRQLPPPELPGADWVRVRTLLGGICGSDLAILDQRQPANSILQAFSSMPAGLGHENVGVVEELGKSVKDSWLGRRVCVEPTLCCKVRGIEPPCPRCSRGEFGACENFGDSGGGSGKLPPGTSIGYNSRTGGSFGEKFVAHESQLVCVPDELSDEQALLTDPLACAMHAVLRAEVHAARRVLVYGTGMLGLGIITAMRAVGYTGWIDALDRDEYLQGLAMAAGADDFLILPNAARQRFARIAELTKATVQRARFGNYMVSGGYDVIFDCVGSRLSMAEALKWARGRGKVIFVATGHGRGSDLTPIWFRELTVIGAWGRQVEDFEGRRLTTYELVHEMMAAGKLATRGLLTHTFPLADYKTAFTVATRKPAHKAVKVAFDFR
ncbi:MAG: zinc-dependent alcohol dehydrogenase [Planctomycetota bacterium]